MRGQGQWMKRGVAGLPSHLVTKGGEDGRNSESGYVSMSACPDRCGFIFPPRLVCWMARVLHWYLLAVEW